MYIEIRYIITVNQKPPLDTTAETFKMKDWVLTIISNEGNLSRKT